MLKDSKNQPDQGGKMFTNRLFVLTIALAFVFIAVLTITPSFGASTAPTAPVSLSDYVRDPSGYQAPYISRSEMLRDRAVTVATYISRSDYVRELNPYAPLVRYVSHSDMLRSLGQ
jgi:hypothetical protein